MSTKYKGLDIKGQKFSKLTVVKHLVDRSHHQANYWECLCDCGNTVSVIVGMITSGRQKSCGCYKKINDKKPKTHGMSRSKPYNVWCGMIARCTNPKDSRWEDYGGRCVQVCEEWRNSFEQFWNDMKDTYREGLTLDRVDVNSGYSKSNCRWTTISVQGHNKRKLENCKSSYIGVTLDLGTLKWRARISVTKEFRKHLGMFKTEYEAALAYDNASELVYGDRPNKTTRL